MLLEQANSSMESSALGPHPPLSPWPSPIIRQGRIFLTDPLPSPQVRRKWWVPMKLTPPQTFWQQRFSGALRGLSVCGGHFRSHSRVLSPGMPYCVGRRRGHPHTRSAGPLWLSSARAGAPRSDPRVVPGALLTVCIHEKSGGLLHCT